MILFVFFCFFSSSFLLLLYVEFASVNGLVQLGFRGGSGGGGFRGGAGGGGGFRGRGRGQ